MPGVRSRTVIHHHDDGYSGRSIPVAPEQSRHMYHCSTCGATWARRNRRAVLSAGPCPGDNVWASSLPPNLEAPWIYPRVHRQPAVWHGAVIQISHALQYYRGCMYCNSCGARSARHISTAFCAPCLLRPTFARVERRLKSMRRGVWPDAGSDWPMPPHSQAPQGFALLRPARGE